MRIVCLTADASSNSLVRLYPIAKVLERSHTVTVAGFRSADDVFAPYRREFDYRTLKTRDLPGFLAQMHRLVRQLQADAVYVFKPLSTSFWTGLAARHRLGVPLLLDIEDWEAGWYRDRQLVDRLKHLVHVERPNSYLWTELNERLLRRADALLVVSRFLQRRFGGTLLPHGADTAYFDPSRWDRGEALERLGLPDAEYVVFTGSPMPNKGLEDLLVALRRVGRPETRLLVVGSFRHDPGYADHLTDHFGDLIVVSPPRPHEEMPLVLSVATLVALPQRPAKETEAQVPGKVFEAMAMGRPVLATAMSDLPEILEGCAEVVPPRELDQLEEGLRRLLHDPAYAQSLGDAARVRCKQRYSWDAMEQILDAEFARLLG